MRSEKVEKLIGRYEEEREFLRERDLFYRAFFSLILKGAALSALAAAILVFVVPQAQKWAQPANNHEIIVAIRQLHIAQAIYVERMPSQEFGTLSQLVESGYLDHDIRSEIWRGYRIEVQPSLKPSENYWIKLSPLDPNRDETYYWCAQNSGLFERSSTDFAVDLVNCRPSKGFTEVPYNWH